MPIYKLQPDNFAQKQLFCVHFNDVSTLTTTLTLDELLRQGAKKALKFQISKNKLIEERRTF